MHVGISINQHTSISSQAGLLSSMELLQVQATNKLSQHWCSVNVSLRWLCADSPLSHGVLESNELIRQNASASQRNTSEHLQILYRHLFFGTMINSTFSYCTIHPAHVRSSHFGIKPHHSFFDGSAPFCNNHTAAVLLAVTWQRQKSTTFLIIQ